MSNEMNVSAVERLENETKIIGKLLDSLKYCSFSGHMAQDVAIGQIYLSGLFTHMKAEVKRLQEASSSPVQVVSDKPAIEVEPKAVEAK